MHTFLTMMFCCLTSNAEVMVLDLGDGMTTEIDTDNFNFRALPLDKGVSSSTRCLAGHTGHF